MARSPISIAALVGAGVISQDQGGGGGDANRWMLDVTGTRMQSGGIYVAQVSENYFASKLRFGAPAYGCKSFLFSFTSAYSTEGGSGTTGAPQETNSPGNAITIDLARINTPFGKIEAVPIDTNVLPNAGRIWFRVDMPSAVTSEFVFEVETIWHVDVGQSIVGQYRIAKHLGDKAWAGASYEEVLALVDSDAQSTTSMDLYYENVGSLSTTQRLVLGPDMMCTKGCYDGRPVVLAIVDSHGYGRQELAATVGSRREWGVPSRLLDRDDSVGRIPHYIMGCPGSAARRELQPNSIERWNALSYIATLNPDSKLPMTCAWNLLGFNDTNASAGSWYGLISALNANLKARYPGLPIIGATLYGQTTSTDAYATLENQTYVANKTPAVLGVVNDNILNNADGNTIAVVDMQKYWGDPSDTFKQTGYLAAIPAGASKPELGEVTALAPVGATTITVNFPIERYVGYRFGALANIGGGPVVDNEDGTWTTMIAALSVEIPVGTKVYYIVNDSTNIHQRPYRIIRTASLIPDSEKAKFPRAA